MKMTLDQVIAEVLKWTKKIAAIGLYIFVALTILRLFGVTQGFISIPSMGPQEFGVFVAGVAYALK